MSWKLGVLIVIFPSIRKQETMENFTSPNYLFYGKSHIVKQLYRKNGKKPFLFAFNTTTKKEYSIEAHFYVKGVMRVRYHPVSVTL